MERKPQTLKMRIKYEDENVIDEYLCDTLIQAGVEQERRTPEGIWPERWRGCRGEAAAASVAPAGGEELKEVVVTVLMIAR